MACYTSIELENLDDNELNRLARKHLKYNLDGELTQAQVRKVKQEAGLIKAERQIRKMQPTAMIKRKGNELEVTVMA